MTSGMNILVFCTDQMRADHMGCAGNPDVKTPNLDALAAEGLRFERSYVSNPVCSPNRASLFTGQFPSRHGLRENGLALPDTAVTLPGVLRDHGYQTFSSGKLHLAPYGLQDAHEVPERWRAEARERWDRGEGSLPTPYHGFDQTFFVGGHGHYNFGDHRNRLSPEVSRGYLRDHAAADSGLKEEVWCSDVPAEQHYNTQIADHMIGFIADRDPETPFFGWCSFPDPHHPFSPPEPWYSAYTGDGITVSPAPDEGDEGYPEVLRKFRTAMRVDAENLGECLAKNYGMISMVDEQVGRVIRSLKEQNLYDNTLIVFLSDHGDYLGDHGLLRKGLLPYEGLYKVPTLWRVPGTGGARGVTEALCGSVDLMPTLLDLVGIPSPDGMQGVSQAPVLTGEHNRVREQLLSEYDASPEGQRVRVLHDDRYAFAYVFGAEFGMLHDLKEDPHQQQNLFDAPSHREIRDRFFDLLNTDAVRSQSWLPEKVCHA